MSRRPSDPMVSQMRDMDREDELQAYLRANVTYPWGLFNLVSCPFFFAFDLDRKFGAVRNSLKTYREIKHDTIVYNCIDEVVFFWNKKNLHHRCDLRMRRVEILNLKS